MPRAAYKYVFCEVWHESLTVQFRARVNASGEIIGPGSCDHVQQKLAMRSRLLGVTGALRIVVVRCLAEAVRVCRLRTLYRRSGSLR